jgi:hypothetical protein
MRDDALRLAAKGVAKHDLECSSPSCKQARDLESADRISPADYRRNCCPVHRDLDRLRRVLRGASDE